VTSSELDPLIHVPTRLKIVATLAALPDGDALSFTRLLYGEWLRRGQRRVDAREHLLAAAGAFARMGATPWRERAESELRATGAGGRRPEPMIR